MAGLQGFVLGNPDFPLVIKGVSQHRDEGGIAASYGRMAAPDSEASTQYGQLGRSLSDRKAKESRSSEAET